MSTFSNQIFSGQPQQRPPNLTPNPGLASQFRQAYPYTIQQQRNIFQTGAGYVPSLQPNSHRTATQQSQVQTHAPQPTATFNPPRGQSSFAFGASTLVQHQQSGVLQQQQSLPSQQQQQQQQLQQQQTNGTTNTMSSLLAQTSNPGPAPSVASTSDVGLDPNDFPALGSAPANVNSSSSNSGSGAGTTSYATQAGTGVLLGGTGGSTTGTSATGGQTRDFTPDDFPALGGQSQTTQQTRDPSNHSSTPDLSHPPGLNGFQQSEQQQQLRQNLLGTQSGGLQQGTPGMLNLGPTQPRNVHPGFQQAPTEAEKQQRVGLFIPYLCQRGCNRIPCHVSVQGLEVLISFYLRIITR